MNRCASCQKPLYPELAFCGACSPRLMPELRKSALRAHQEGRSEPVAEALAFLGGARS